MLVLNNLSGDEDNIKVEVFTLLLLGLQPTPSPGEDEDDVEDVPDVVEIGHTEHPGKQICWNW